MIDTLVLGFSWPCALRTFVLSPRRTKVHTHFCLLCREVYCWRDLQRLGRINFGVGLSPGEQQSQTIRWKKYSWNLPEFETKMLQNQSLRGLRVMAKAGEEI